VLTRLEVKGFKNLLDFTVDLGPYTCIAGPNGVGKSNIFDAVHFLSLLADHTLTEATLRVRGTDPETADLRDLLWTDGRERADSFSMAADMIVEPRVVDDFGRAAEASSTYLRYEIKLRYEVPAERGTLGRLILEKEALTYFTEGEAAQRLRFPHSSKAFRKKVVINRRRARSGYISTAADSEEPPAIHIHQDGNAGLPQSVPARSTPRTVVASANTVSTPTILAVRREMQSWRLLGLEPSAMRRADRFHSAASISENEHHLPATLYRLATEAKAAGKDPEQIYARVAARLSELVEARSLEIDVDEVRQILTLEVREGATAPLPARSLSDGTLRFLALCTLVEDPKAKGLLCMEEPENGIHPAKIGAMVDLLHDLAVDPDASPGVDNPMRQLIVATHSPYFVQLQRPEDLLLASPTSIRLPSGRPAQTLRCLPLSGTWRTGIEEKGIGRGAILDYLTAPPGAQLSLW